MEQIKKNIEESVLDFIKAYEFKTPMKTIWGDGVQEMRVMYKYDYFDPNSPYYKKGLCDILVIFTSNYRVIIRQIISGSWCFALLSEPYNVTEEVWQLSDKQLALLPTLTKALESGFLYKNNYGNFKIVGK